MESRQGIAHKVTVVGIILILFSILNFVGLAISIYGFTSYYEGKHSWQGKWWEIIVASFLLGAVILAVGVALQIIRKKHAK